MENTKLFQLLGTLDAYGLNRLSKFLRSPYFNEDQNLVKLFEAVLPYFKTNAAIIAEQEKLWKRVYPQGKYNQLKFARLCSDLLKKVEEFIVTDRLKHSDAEKLKELLAYYNEKQLLKHYPDTSNLARKKLQQTVYRDGEYYLQLFRLESYQNNFLELKNQRSTEKNILQTTEALDAFYLINKLNYLSAILHYKKFLSVEGEMKMAGEILAHLNKNSYGHIPAIQIHYKIVLTLTEPENETHFHDLKTQLAKHYQLFPKSNARNLFAFAINYCIRKINFGKLDYVNELLELYKQMLKAGLMTDDEGMISQFDYKNIVTVALRAGDARWTEKFIADYKNKIPKADRQNAYTFNLARLYFYQRKFNQVLPLLQNVVYSDIFYQLDSKTTLMKTYFELGEYLPLMALKESFRILLRRKKLISEQNRINYMNLMRFTMKLYRIDVKDQKKLTSLGKQITESSNVADKSWLMEKLNELTAG